MSVLVLLRGNHKEQLLHKGARLGFRIGSLGKSTVGDQGLKWRALWNSWRRV